MPVLQQRRDTSGPVKQIQDKSLQASWCYFSFFELVITAMLTRLWLSPFHRSFVLVVTSCNQVGSVLLSTSLSLFSHSLPGGHIFRLVVINDGSKIRMWYFGVLRDAQQLCWGDSCILTPETKFKLRVQSLNVIKRKLSGIIKKFYRLHTFTFRGKSLALKIWCIDFQIDIL